MNQLRELFLQASPREQMVIAAGGGFLTILLLFTLVLMPMQKKRDKQFHMNEAALSEQQQVRELASQLLGKAQTPDQSVVSGSLIDVLNATLPKYQLQMEDFQPSGNADARVRLAKADLNSVLAWLNEMENVDGVQVKELTAATGPETGSAIINVRLHRD